MLSKKLLSLALSLSLVLLIVIALPGFSSGAKEEKEQTEKFNMPITELELSVRSSNCLREAKIKTIGDLVKKTEMEMLKYRNFGKKSLSEINVILVNMGLTLGIKTDKKGS